VKNGMRLRGFFQMEVLDKDGNLLSKHELENGIVDEGLNTILNVMFHGTAALATWYIGIIDALSFSALSASDVMSSHAGWIELTAYTEAVRQTWNEAAASGKSITSSTLAAFTINATKTVKGIFLTSNSAKSGTTGTLWSTALLPSGDVSVVSGNSLRITYTVRASEA
jgi:hypothetical protein